MTTVNPVELASEEIKGLVKGALDKIISETASEGDAPVLPQFNVEIPADKSHGDFATNAALASAKALRSNPRKIAEQICANISLEGTSFDKVEIAGPGFINFFLSPDWFGKVVLTVIEQNTRFGRTDFGKGKKILLEFVSANPTGPMHIGNARGGAIGDCLASVLECAGYNVCREFYINDA